MQIHAVFVRGQAEPVAFFSDADQAQRWRRAEHGDAAVVVPVEASVSKSALDEAGEAAAASFVPVPAAPTPDPDAALRGEIRTQLELEERRKRLTAEVRKEMRAADEDEPSPPASPSVPRRAARE